MKDIDTWNDGLINFWRSKGIQLKSGATLAEISKTESIIGFKFPEAFIILYLKVDGFDNNDWDENMISIWPLGRILDEYGRYKGFVGFSDYLINSHVFGFVKDQEGIFKNYDLAESDLPEKIAESFQEGINLINLNSDLLY